MAEWRDWEHSAADESVKCVGPGTRQNGSRSLGKRILIDGQQRVTTLMAGLLCREVVTRDYRTVRIRIAFHRGERRFEVSNPAIEKSPARVPNIAACAQENGSTA